MQNDRVYPSIYKQSCLGDMVHYDISSLCNGKELEMKEGEGMFVTEEDTFKRELLEHIAKDEYVSAYELLQDYLEAQK